MICVEATSDEYVDGRWPVPVKPGEKATIEMDATNADLQDAPSCGDGAAGLPKVGLYVIGRRRIHQSLDVESSLVADRQS